MEFQEADEVSMGMLRNEEYEMDDATSESSQELPDSTMGDDSQDAVPEANNMHNNSTEMDNDDLLLSLATPANSKTWNWILGGNEEMRTPFDHVGTGWTVELPENAKEMDYWKLTFPDTILSDVVRESNDYAIHIMENSDSLSRRQQKFKAVSYDEFLRYLAVRIIMGVDQKPEFDMYWSRDPILGSIVVRDIMSSDRFYEIQRYLHLSDAETPDENDKIFKIRRFRDHTMLNFQNLIVPHDYLSIDESLVKSRARIKFKQFIPTKRNRFGVKTFSLVDERTGFIVNSIIYEGKATSTDHQTVSASDKKQFGHGGGIVLQLCQPYLGRFRTGFADNYFNSPNLADKLLKEKTYLCGTLRSGRMNAPKPPKGMKRGDLEAKHDELVPQIMVEFWRDKRVVKMISTGFEHALIETSNAAGTSKQKLKTICEYNNNARGIDRADQMMGLYDTGRKTMKWSTRMFFRLLDMTIYNAFVMMKSLQGPTPYLTFKLNLVRQILSSTGGVQSKIPRTHLSTRIPSANGPERLSARHFPGKGAKRGCHVFSKRRTVFTCKNCGVPLCIVPCFEKYHTVMNYK